MSTFEQVVMYWSFIASQASLGLTVALIIRLGRGMVNDAEN